MISIIEEAKSRLGEIVGSFLNGEFSNSFATVPESTIKEAETRLGISFPDDYRQFVRDYGDLMINGVWIYGIQNNNFDDPMICDGVRATLDARKVSKLPDNLFIIVDKEGDEYHCINCSKPYGPIVRWDVYKSGITDELNASFSEYLIDCVRRVFEHKGISFSS